MSDSPWFGAVADRWRILPARALFSEVDKRNQPNEQLLSVTISRGVVPQRELLADSSKRDSSNEDKSAYKLVLPGDIVYNKMRAWQGAIGLSEHCGIVSPAYVVQRPRTGVNARFFHYLLRTPAFSKEAERWSYGIASDQWSLRPAHFKMIDFPVPSADEQEAIVRLIDHADRRIRRAIRAKQKLIALLNEQKQAVIHSAVTRGLDPNVRLKPSGMDWVGDVPAHWNVTALRFRYAQCLGKMLDLKQQTGSNPLPYLRNVDVQWDRINTKDLPTMDIAPSEYERYTVKPGDLLVCEGGEVGRSAIWAGDVELCGFQKALHRLRPLSDRDLPRFQYYALRAAASSNAFSDGHESTIGHLTGEKLRAHRFPFPPREEQAEITACLDEVLGRIEGAIRLAQHEIASLREYQTRLITGVVTGELDVRKAAAELPDEFDDREPLDKIDAEQTEEWEVEDVERVEA